MKKIFFIFGVALFVSLFVAPSAKAMTADELNAQIAALRVQIVALQAQLGQLQDQPSAWCHNFNINLSYGSSGTEVRELRTALEKEGFPTTITFNPASFDEGVASAISGFQEKYKSEILTPLGLKYPTGYVGKATREKLNKLYGCIKPICIQVLTPAKNPTDNQCKIFPTPCDVPTGWVKILSCPIIASSITVLSPNGEEKLVQGKTYQISWKSSADIDRVDIYLDSREMGGSMTIARNVINTGQYDWTIPAAVYVLGINEIRIQTTSTRNPEVFDRSDNAFSIISATTTNPSITVLSPNGGETWLAGTEATQASLKQTVTWSTKNISSESIKPTSLDISLVDDTGSKWGLVMGAPDNGRAEVFVPRIENLSKFGKYYKIKIKTTGESPVIDYSDNYFNIIKKSPVTFLNLSANLNSENAVFKFDYSGSSTNSYSVDISTYSDMSWDVYKYFGSGVQKIISVANPKTKWEKYVCGKTLYWQVYNNERTASSSIQSVVVDCSLSTKTPIVDLKINNSDEPITVSYYDSANITWGAIYADSCVASGGWSGAKSTGGSQSTEPLTFTKTYSITCSGQGVSVTDSISVNVITTNTKAAVLVDSRLYNLTKNNLNQYIKLAEERRKFDISVISVYGIDDWQPTQVKEYILNLKNDLRELEGVLFVGNIKYPSFYKPRGDNLQIRLFSQYYADLDGVFSRTYQSGSIDPKCPINDPYCNIFGDFIVPEHNFDQMEKGVNPGPELWIAILPVGFSDNSLNNYNNFAKQLDPFFAKVIKFYQGEIVSSKKIYKVSNQLWDISDIWNYYKSANIDFYSVNQLFSKTEKPDGCCQADDYCYNSFGADVCYVRAPLENYSSFQNFWNYYQTRPWMGENWQSSSIYKKHMTNNNYEFVWTNVHSSESYSLISSVEARSLVNGGLVHLSDGCSTAGFYQPGSSVYVDTATAPNDNVLVSYVYGSSNFLAAIGDPFNRGHESYFVKLISRMNQGDYLGKAFLERWQTQYLNSSTHFELKENSQEMLIGDPFLDTI